jgi:zinc protease
MKISLWLLLIAGTSILFGGTPVSGTSNEPNVVLLPVKNDPTISFRIWFKIGSQNEPPGKEGLAAITARMMTEAATQNNSYDQILDKLFPLAASYGVSPSIEMTVVTGRVHKDNIKDYYPLFTDAILRPAFKQTDLDRIKDEVFNHLERTLRYASDEELGKAVLYNNVFDGTPYGHLTAGTVEAVKSITIDDVKGFYRKYYTRDNYVLGLGGGYDDALLEQLRKDLGTLPEGIPAPVAVSVPKPISGLHVTIVEKEAASTAISMGFPIDILRGPKDWYALAVANSWLGEHRNSSSHLYQVIRETRGLNYGDYSYIERYPNGGQRSKPPQNVGLRQQIFEIWIRPVPNETRLFTLRAALREFKLLVDKGMTQEDFDLTRNFLSKYVLHYAPTTMERLGYALDDQFYGMNESHLEKFQSVLKDLTLVDVNAAIQKYWHYGYMQIAVVTKDAASLKTALVQNAPSPITYQMPKPQSVLDEDKEISTFPLGIKESNVSIVPVSELFVGKR